MRASPATQAQVLLLDRAFAAVNRETIGPVILRAQYKGSADLYVGLALPDFQTASLLSTPFVRAARQLSGLKVTAAEHLPLIKPDMLIDCLGSNQALWDKIFFGGLKIGNVINNDNVVATMSLVKR